MRGTIALLLALAALPALAEKGTTLEYELQATGELVVDVDGRVRDYTLDAGLKGQVEAAVRKNIETWRFEPILEQGRPVAGRTRMSIALQALPRDNGDYVLKVRDVWFGGPTARGERKPPRYPTEAMKQELGARVMLVVRLDAEGNVADVHPYQTSLSKPYRSEALARRWRREFEQASIAAVRKWKFAPGESIGDRTVESTMMVPLLYSASAGTSAPRIDNVWRSYQPGPISPAPWVDASSLAEVDADALGEGQAAALNSAFRLRSDVVGKAL